ncbi:MAG: hypothetical protein NVSMB2_12130 [Chloroflexota bacterium]
MKSTTARGSRLRRARWPAGGATVAALALVLGCGAGARTLQSSTGEQTPAAQLTLSVVADRALPGNTSRFDYLSLDADAHRLYIAHLGAGTLVVFDMQAGTVLTEIGGVSGVHGILAVPELGRIYASATDRHQVFVIDAASLTVLATSPGGQYPDGIALDPELGKLYVSDETGGADTVIDASTNQIVTTIALGGEVGNTVFDSGAHQIIAAVQSKNQIVTIDPTTDSVSGRYDTPACERPHGLAVDPARRLAFVGCEGNAKMGVFDLTGHRLVSLHDVGNTPDVLAIDPAWNLLYVAAENGPLTVFAESDTDARLVARQDVGPNAHSIAVDLQTHHVFIALANVGGAPVLRELVIETPG